MMNKKAIYHRTDDFTLLQGDCIRLMGEFDFKFDMIFADPPYFLSNGGISVQSGKVVCVDKGEWDKGGSPEHIDQFNEEWISACREHLKKNGTIWVSGNLSQYLLRGKQADATGIQNPERHYVG